MAIAPYTGRMQIEAALRVAVHAGLGFMFPPRCLTCGGETMEAGVCPACFAGLSFIGDPLCRQCGVPFDYHVGEDALCAACIAAPPPFDQARAALAYNDASRPMIVALKHDRTHGLRVLGNWMRRGGGPLIDRSDLVCPVPLHRWRLMGRGYNQAALLAATTGGRVIPDLLLRRKATRSQGGLSRSGRQRNVRSAFAVNPRFAAMVKDKSVLLVDDVFTTGATVNECCRVLRRAGAARVTVLCLARVLSSTPHV